jgi:hypothetical protein
MDEHAHSAIHTLADDVKELKKLVAWCPACTCHEVVDRIILHVDAVIQSAKLLDELNRR